MHRAGGREGGGVNALLQKASSQLKGERLTQKSQDFSDFEDDGEGLDAYFSQLKTKQASTIQWDKFDESDVSMDDAPQAQNVGSSASRFLKKKAPEKRAKTPPSPKRMKNTATTKSLQKIPKALQAANAKTQKKLFKSERIVLSDSDMDMSLSLDEDVLAKLRPKSGQDPVESLKVKQTEWKSNKTPRTPTPVDEVDNDFFNELNLATVDDLLGRRIESDVDEVSEAIGGYSSEIRTERSLRPSTPLRSILSPSPRPTPRLSGSRVRLSLDNVQEVTFGPRSSTPDVISLSRRSYSYDNLSESDVAETINTEQSSEEEIFSDYTITSGRSSPERQPSLRWRQESEYSDDFNSFSHGTSRSVRRYSRNLSTDTGTDHYSDDFASVTTEQTSDLSRASSPELKPHRPVKMKSRESQTGIDVGLHYHWTQNKTPAMADCDFKMAHIDPTPIATHVVSPEALETMTAYNPSMIMLNDMLRQQLEITNQFMDTQKRLYGSMINTLYGPDGSLLSDNYTTLADYKKYVRKNKRPIISFKEALRQVKEEMGID